MDKQVNGELRLKRNKTLLHGKRKKERKRDIFTAMHAVEIPKDGLDDRDHVHFHPLRGRLPVEPSLGCCPVR